MCLSVLLPAYPCNIRIFQAANGVETSYDLLANLLGSIEHLLRRIEIYTQIPHTPALDEMVVRIMVELISTLALAAKGLMQGRSGESSLVNAPPYSMQHSEIPKKTVWREGYRGSTTKVRPTHTR